MRISVPGTGSRDAKIVIVGEGPDYQDHVAGKPFAGQSGQELDNCLMAAEMVRSEIYITNVVKNGERPLNYFFVKPKRGDAYLTEAGIEQQDFLKDEILSIGPFVIIAMGNAALFALTGRYGITKWRGSVIESTLIPGLKVIPVLHPETLLNRRDPITRQFLGAQYTNRYLIMDDLKKARHESRFPEIIRKDRQLIIAPRYNEVIDYLHEAIELGRSGTILDLDIEVDLKTEEITCICVAINPITCMSIPFVEYKGDYFTIEQETDIWLLIAQIIESPDIATRGQNFSFDLHFMLRCLGIKPQGDIHDTMIAQKLLLPDFPVGLDFITSTRTDMPYYKEDGKKWISGQGGAWDMFWRYNAIDGIATAEASVTQLQDLIKQDNLPTYDRQRAIILPLLFMQEHGIRVDIAGVLKERDKTVIEIEELHIQLNELAGYELNPNSPKQLKEYFYDLRGEKPYKKKGSVSVDEMALKRLARKGYKEAGIIKKLRTLKTKTLGTYLNIEKFSRDGRYRSAYKPVGTKTGRLSSSENIFGEGGNQQNWPHNLMRYLTADEGEVIYSFDLSQAENRIVAYVGRVTEMIEAFEHGTDIHSLTGALISGLPIEQVMKDDKANVCCHLGDGLKTWRFWGKKSNHGLNYDFGAKAFALLYEIPEKDGKYIVDKYHHMYPGIRSNYHSYIREMLMSNRTVTNLMGRHRLFLGKLDDHLFKEAYAQIPQSSVADKINEHGLLHIWNNQDIYKPVKLKNQIHDSIGFGIPLPPKVSWLDHAVMLLRIKQELEIPFSFHEREFVVPADLTMGLNFNKEDGYDWKAASIPTDPHEFAEDLERRFKELKR